jgi:hypothetical protein
MWMPDPDMFRDEIFTLARGEFAEYMFRKDCVKGLTWTCDGDGWSSERVWREHGPMEYGQYYIARD